MSAEWWRSEMNRLLLSDTDSAAKVVYLDTVELGCVWVALGGIHCWVGDLESVAARFFAILHAVDMKAHLEGSFTTYRSHRVLVAANRW